MNNGDSVLVTHDEIEPIRELLGIARYARSVASDLLAGTEQEYQTLRCTYLPSTGDKARRFRYLCWVRELLRAFITQQVVANQDLALGARIDSFFARESNSSIAGDEGTGSAISDLPAAA